MDSTNRNTALASALVEELVRCGMRRAVLSPGSRSTPLALALWRAPELTTDVVLDERSAGFVALGGAQATGDPVAVLCTSGSAAANLHPAVVEADESALPLIVLTADRPPELRGVGAGQTIDQLKLYGAAVRWFCEVGTHDADDSGLLHYRQVGCRAFATARGEPRPGPVHLNLPWREPLAPLERDGEVTATSPLALDGRGTAPLAAIAPSPSAPDPGVVERLAERITETPRGLILAGRQTDRELAAGLAGLAEASGYPVLAEPTSQVRLGSHDRSRIVWSYDAIARARPAALAPDLVLRFGEMPTSKTLREWLAALEPEIVAVAAHGWHEPTRRAGLIVRGRGAETAALVAARLSGGPSRHHPWEEGWRRAGDLAAEAIEAELADQAEPTEPGIQARLASLYASGDLVYTASSMPIRDQESFLPTTAADVTFLANRGANGIDGLVSSGAGAAAATTKPTWIVTGDLGLVHDANGLAAVAAVADAPVRVVVVNNSGGGIFEFLAQAEEIERQEFESLFATPSTVDPGRLAAAYGLAHRRIESLDELEDATAETGVVEVVTERRRNVELHRRIAARVAEAIVEAA